jgi:hypothetical protein
MDGNHMWSGVSTEHLSGPMPQFGLILSYPLKSTSKGMHFFMSINVIKVISADEADRLLLQSRPPFDRRASHRLHLPRMGNISDFSRSQIFRIL